MSYCFFLIYTNNIKKYGRRKLIVFKYVFSLAYENLESGWGMLIAKIIRGWIYAYRMLRQS